jgi:hypothetical protein
MYWLVFLLGAFAVVGGALSLSQATTGVGIVAIGCFLGIAARVVQAEAHEKHRRRAESTHPIDGPIITGPPAQRHQVPHRRIQ